MIDKFYLNFIKALSMGVPSIGILNIHICIFRTSIRITPIGDVLKVLKSYFKKKISFNFLF